MAEWVGEATGLQARRIARPRRLVVFWLAALVLVLLPLEWWLLPYNLKVADIGLVLLIAAGSLWLLTHRQRVRLPLLIPFWMILFSSALATTSGLVFTDSLLAILQEVYLYVWFVVLANLLVHLPEKQFEALLRLWSLVALVEATATLMGMFHFGPAMFYTNPNGLVVHSGLSLDRAVGTFANPNAAGTYLFISFFVMLAARWPVWFSALAGSWLIIGMFATGSMGALLATVAGFGGLILIAIPRKSRPVITLFAVLTGALLILLLGLSWTALATGAPATSQSDLFLLTLGRLPRSVMSRFGLIQHVWPLYQQYPLGIGPNASSAFLGSLHNDYFAFLVERGPIGLIGWLWILGAVLAQPLRTVRLGRDRTQAWVALALGAGFLAVCLNAFTHELSHFRQVWVLMAFLFAACWRARISD